MIPGYVEGKVIGRTRSPDPLNPASRKRSRVLYVCHTSAPGGAELALLRLIDHLDQSLFEPVALLFAKGVVYERLRAMGVRTYCIPLAENVNGASRSVLNWSALLRLKEVALILAHIVRVSRFIRLHQIDLVHTNSLKAAVIGGLSAVLARRRIVWHIHDRIASDYLPATAVFVFRFLARMIPDFVVANSLSTLQTFLPTPPRHCAVVYPGVDLNVPLPATVTSEGAAGGRVLCVGLVGRISPTKGQDVFLAAAARVAKELPRVTFQVVGGAFFNDQLWEDHIRRLAESYPGLSVEFTGFCSDVPQRIAGLDVLVHASTIPEPFGQVVAEAMACSKPVVAIGAGGVPEVVIDGETGWLVPPNDPEAMAEKILWLLNHPAEAAEMGVRGRKRAEDHFALTKMARKVEAVYNHVLGFKALDYLGMVGTTCFVHFDYAG